MNFAGERSPGNFVLDQVLLVLSQPTARYRQAPANSLAEVRIDMKPKKSPPAKGQGTLFSFFSKKEPTRKTDQSTPGPKLEQSTPTAKTQPSTPKGPANKPVSQPKAQANSELSSQEPAELVGKRIKVFWRDDDNWYFGKVVDFSSKDGTHLVHYDDGDKEKVVLANEKVSSSPCCVAPYLCDRATAAVYT